MKLKSALELNAEVRLVLNENERAKKISDAVKKTDSMMAFAVGPEGGWAEEELAAFEVSGWQSVTLGSQILRAETAAIAVLAAVAAILD